MNDMYTKPQNIDTSAEHVHEIDKSIHDFKPDWDMIAPFHERIKELEIENEKLRQALAQPEQEPMAVLKVWDEKEQKHVLMNYYLTPPNKPEQEPVAWEKSYDIACALLRQAHDILAMTQYPIKRPWVSLTEEESSDIYNAHHNTYGECITSAHDLVLDIEAQLKERNT